jgi:hypothetical protein
VFHSSLLSQPLGFAAREHLRKKVIGKFVTFNVLFAAGGREFANVMLGEENLGLSLSFFWCFSSYSFMFDQSLFLCSICSS